MAFSWKQMLEKSIEIKQRRHMTKLNQCLSPSGEVTDKAFKTRFESDLKILKSNPALIKKRIKEEVEKKHMKSLESREKRK